MQPKRTEPQKRIHLIFESIDNSSWYKKLLADMDSITSTKLFEYVLSHFGILPLWFYLCTYMILLDVGFICFIIYSDPLYRAMGVFCLIQGVAVALCTIFYITLVAYKYYKCREIAKVEHPEWFDKPHNCIGG